MLPGRGAETQQGYGGTVPTSTRAQPAVLVTSRSFSSGTLPLREELVAHGCEVLSGPADHALDALEPLLARADVWIAGAGPVGAEHLAAAPRLRLVARYGVGTDAVDLTAAAARGVLVTNTPGANTAAVAEHTLTLMLAALRRLPAADRAARAGDRAARRSRQLGGLTVGIVGFGRIGRMVAQLVRGFGARLVAADPLVAAADAAAAGVELVTLEELLEVADLISLHAPGDGVLVDEAFVRRTRSDAVLVNTARAALVDEAAVAAALRSGHLGSYAADVVGDEGATGAAALDSPLLAADLAECTVLTPHIAAQTLEAVDLMGRGAVDAVLAVLQGDNPPNLVTAGPAPRSGAAS